VRIAMGMGIGASCVLGCSGGVLDVGSADASVALQAAPTPEAYSAEAVSRARHLCKQVFDNNWTTYAQSDLRTSLTGGWLLCLFQSQEDKRSLQFTTDGHWYTLVADQDGGLTRGTPAAQDYDGSPIGYQGRYTFQDGNGEPSGADGGAVFVATNGVRWFHPEFTEDLMLMGWATDGSQNTCVRIGP
jgi:hypothetical protein